MKKFLKRRRRTRERTKEYDSNVHTNIKRLWQVNGSKEEEKKYKILGLSLDNSGTSL